MTRYEMVEDEPFLSEGVGTNMFGTNYVTTYDFEIARDPSSISALNALGTTVLRYPGGSVTEADFADSVFLTGDWDAMSHTDNGITRSLTPLSDFFIAAGMIGADVHLVIPTRVAFEKSAGQALADGTFGDRAEFDQEYFGHVERFVNEAMRLATEHEVDIARFEIGNEFWGSGEMSASEYGYLSGRLAKFLGDKYPEVDTAIQIVSSGNNFSPVLAAEVYLEPDGTGDYTIHSADQYQGDPPSHWLRASMPAEGNALTQNETIAREFLSEPHALQYLNAAISHVYFNGGFDNIDGERDFALRSALDAFTRALGVSEIDHYVTEWSPRNRGGSTGNADGLQYAHTTVEAFFELASNGVDGANFWPTTFGSPGIRHRTLIDTQDNELTFGGVAFQWLTNAHGLMPLFDYEVAGEIDVHGFGDGARTVIYVAERGYAEAAATRQHAVEVDLGAFAPGSSYFLLVSGLHSNDGSATNDLADPAVIHEDGYVTSGDVIALNLEAWELAMVRLQAVTDGNDVIQGGHSHDTILGAGGDDSLCGNDGDDTIKGGWGADTIDGGIGNDLLVGDSGNDILRGGAGNDMLQNGGGLNLLFGGLGNDAFILNESRFFTSEHWASNSSSETQAGTGVRVNLGDMRQFNVVIDGGAGHDVIQLSEGNDAFALHDALSGFHEALTLTADSSGHQGVARFTGIEEIRGMDGNDLIDLTSPDYSLLGTTLIIDGGAGDDMIWGSDANEKIIGGEGNDVLFGGAGNDMLLGGAGADTFEFTKTSDGTAVLDFDPAEGDLLRFYNSDGAAFDLASLQTTRKGFSIAYTDEADETSHRIEIAIDPMLSAMDLIAAVEIM